MWGLITEAAYEKNKADMKQYVTDYVAQNIAELDHCREMGDTAEMISDALYPGKTYYIWAACIDEFGKPSADIHTSAPFSTLPGRLSSATVSANTGKYFDGDELYALDPVRHAEGAGKAFVQVECSATEDAATWYVMMIKEDPENPTASIPDEEIAAMSESTAIEGITGRYYWCDWDSAYTVLGVAIDKEDNNSPVFRHGTTFTKEGASPTSELPNRFH